MLKQWTTTGLAALVATLFVAIIALFHSEAKDLNALVDAYRQHHETYVVAARMRQSTNDLTRLARTYVVTGNKKFEDQYLKILDTRDGKFPEPENYDRVYWDYFTVDGQEPPAKLTEPISYDEVIQRAELNGPEKEQLSQARQKSDELAKFEQSVFRELTLPSVTPPVARLFDENYHVAKLDILSKVNAVFDSIFTRARQLVHDAEQSYHDKQLFQYALFGALLLTAIGWVYTTHKETRTAMQMLDNKVAERTSSLNESNEKLRKAIAEIRTLEGLLPICAYCHNIRESDGSWVRLEDYISNRSEVQFTHGMCPECLKKESSKIKPQGDRPD